MPDFLQILLSGSHRGQAAGILDQVLPDIVAGRLVMLSKCTPGGFTRALQMRPALRNAFDTVRLRALTPDETAALAREFTRRVATQFPVEFRGRHGPGGDAARASLSRKPCSCPVRCSTC